MEQTGNVFLTLLTTAVSHSALCLNTWLEGICVRNSRALTVAWLYSSHVSRDGIRLSRSAR